MKLRANAKINLCLQVCGKRQDGYHLIDTVMHSVSLYDEIEITKADGVSVESDNLDIKQEDNIAFKAAKLFFQDYGINGGAAISISKNIPSAAGLGGGSADAAGVLVGLNKLYNANISKEQLCKTALKLGADVPFFIDGGCARAQGIGEELTPLKPLKCGCFLLAKAEKKPSTAEMYKILDSKEPITCDTTAVIDAVESGDLEKLSGFLVNSFATIWQESEVKSQLLALKPLAVSLSGSGPTWFALFQNEADVKKAQNELEKKNIDCWLATPEIQAIIFE